MKAGHARHFAKEESQCILMPPSKSLGGKGADGSHVATCRKSYPALRKAKNAKIFWFHPMNRIVRFPGNLEASFDIPSDVHIPPTVEKWKGVMCMVLLPSNKQARQNLIPAASGRSSRLPGVIETPDAGIVPAAV